MDYYSFPEKDNASQFAFLKALISRDRSVRRFLPLPVAEIDLLQIIDLVRYCASGRNAQPLKYKIVSTPEYCDKVFPHLKWAGYYQDWDGPAEHERPSAYIIQCLDLSIASNTMADDGLQMQAITLGATALQLGCCIIKSFNALEVANALNINQDTFKLLHVIAVGYPAENVFIQDIRNDDFKYFRDENDNQIVPKRKLSQILL